MNKLHGFQLMDELVNIIGTTCVHVYGDFFLPLKQLGK